MMIPSSSISTNGNVLRRGGSPAPYSILRHVVDRASRRWDVTVNVIVVIELGLEAPVRLTLRGVLELAFDGEFRLEGIREPIDSHRLVENIGIEITFETLRLGIDRKIFGRLDVEEIAWPVAPRRRPMPRQSQTRQTRRPLPAPE